MIRHDTHAPQGPHQEAMISSLQDLLAQGGPTLVVIGATAAVGFALFIERALVCRQFSNHIPPLERRLRDLIAHGAVPDVLQACSKAPLGLAPVLTRGVEAWMRGADRDHILGEMARETRRLTMQIRRGLGLLSTLGSLSPFLGLFGTVLGIIESFDALSASASVSLRTVGPGIADALVATAAGLFAAIPAAVFYNYLGGLIREQGAKMEDFALEFMNLVERTFEGQ